MARKQTLLMVGIPLLLALIWGSPLGAQAIPLDQAVQGGKVAVEITGLGGSTGDVILVTAQRQVQETLRLMLAPGTIFKSKSGAVQDMVGACIKGERVSATSYRPATEIVLTDNRRHAYVVEAYCMDFHKENPRAGDRFTVAVPQDRAGALILGGKKARARIQVIQSALWFDREGLSNTAVKSRFPVTDEDIEGARCLLRNITNRPGNDAPVWARIILDEELFGQKLWSGMEELYQTMMQLTRSGGGNPADLIGFSHELVGVTPAILHSKYGAPTEILSDRDKPSITYHSYGPIAFGITAGAQHFGWIRAERRLFEGGFVKSAKAAGAQLGAPPTSAQASGAFNILSVAQGDDRGDLTIRYTYSGVPTGDAAGRYLFILMVGKGDVPNADVIANVQRTVTFFVTTGKATGQLVSSESGGSIILWFGPKWKSDEPAPADETYASLVHLRTAGISITGTAFVWIQVLDCGKQPYTPASNLYTARLGF